MQQVSDQAPWETWASGKPVRLPTLKPWIRVPLNDTRTLSFAWSMPMKSPWCGGCGALAENAVQWPPGVRQ